MAGGEEQPRQADDLPRGERPGPHMIDHEPADQIILGVLVLAPDQLGEIAVAKLLIMTAAASGDIDSDEISLAPVLDQRVIGVRHAEQCADRLAWQGGCEVGDEIGGRFFGYDPVDQRIDQRLNLGSELLDAAAGEFAGQELALRGVLGRIHLREHLILPAHQRQRGGLRRIARTGGIGTEPRIPQQRANVFVAGDEPGRRAVPLRDLAHALLAAPTAHIRPAAASGLAEATETGARRRTDRMVVAERLRTSLIPDAAARLVKDRCLL